jgi:PAS domain S-box-containing protein
VIVDPTADSLPDPRVLGLLLSSENVLQALPNQRLNEFVCAMFADVPGIARARLVLDTPETVASTGTRLDGAPHLESGGNDMDQKNSDAVVFSLDTSYGCHGRLMLDLADPSLFAPYDPFVANYASSLALLLENRLQRNELNEALALVSQSERKYRQLFAEMTAGHAVHEIILDPAGMPCDYRFIEVNPAFERQTGLKSDQIVGKTVCEILPGIEPSWIERYGQVALSGEPCRFEDYNHNLDRHYDVIAYRPQSGQFAVVFTDITERKQLESRLQEASEELQAMNEELAAQNEELIAQQDELVSSNQELLNAQEEADRLRVEQQTVLERLQQTLIDLPRQSQGVRFAHLYRSATRGAQVGGDFYDVFEAKNARVGLLVGDVSGHGVEAARMAMLVRDTVRAFSRHLGRPHAILRDTNLLLVDRGIPGFITAFFGLLDPATGRLVFSSAGHPPVLLRRSGWAEPMESFGVPLGVFREARYRDQETILQRGDVLVLYTDGLTEARRGNLLFGETGLALAAEGAYLAPIDRLPALLFDAALEFSNGGLADDAAVLTVRYEGVS